MQNPNTQKNYLKQAMQKRLSGKDNNKNQGNNNINKQVQKPQSKVENKNKGLDKISVNNIRNSYKKQNSHNVNQVEINYSNDNRKQIKSNNQVKSNNHIKINLNPPTKKQEMNPKTHQLMIKNQVGKQNQDGMKNPFGKLNQGGMQNQGGMHNQRGIQNQVGIQNQRGIQNQVGMHNQRGTQNKIGMQNQRGMQNQVGMHNQVGIHHQGAKPVIMKKNVGQINGQKLPNNDNNNKAINNNMILNSNMNINSDGNNQPKFRGKPLQIQTPNQPKNIEYVKLSREDKTFYINSTLYCLANNEKISKYLFDNYKNETPENPQRLITFLFWRVIFHLNMKDTIEYSLEKFYKYITPYNPVFKDINSKNLVGFLIFLLEQFHEEDKKFRKMNKEIELKEESYSNDKEFQNYLKICEDTFVYNNYGWVNEKKVKCLVCNKETITYSYFFTYDLNISSAINKYIIKLSSGNTENSQDLTIRKCLDYNAEQERLYNVYCKSCDKKTNLERQNLIHLLSDNIIILLSGIEQRDIIDLIKENNIIIKVDKNLEIYKRQYRINSIIYYDVNNKKYLNYCYKKNKWIKYTYVDIKEEINEDFLNKADINVVPVVIFYSLKINK